MRHKTKQQHGNDGNEKFEHGKHKSNTLLELQPYSGKRTANRPSQAYSGKYSQAYTQQNNPGKHRI